MRAISETDYSDVMRCLRKVWESLNRSTDADGRALARKAAELRNKLTKAVKV